MTKAEADAEVPGPDGLFPPCRRAPQGQGQAQAGVGRGQGIPNVAIIETCMEHRIHESIPFSDFLGQHLPFKIPVHSQEVVSQYPNKFVFGSAEYTQAVDVWLEHKILSMGTETSVVVLDAQWQQVLKTICSLTVMLNEKDPSSDIKLRPDFTGMFGGMLVIKGEAKLLARDLESAIDELVHKFHDTAHLMFPRGARMIPGIASCLESISLHCISYENRKFRQRHIRTYNVSELFGRVEFIEDIFKLAVWILSQTKPKQQFYLPSGVRMATPNGHHVALLRDGIVKKEFHHITLPRINMDVISKVYDARLANVEQGRTNCSSITIISVGRRLSDALNDSIVTKDAAYNQISLAVEQLHGIGVAHCDICVGNIFVSAEESTVFLGDLEYCQEMLAPAPQGLRRSSVDASNGKSLDKIQLRNLRDELALL
eukprot:CAMPEP_0114467014 /NCGR_PEP_ID=MMETSP0104-20121206/9385_1 /TAXON_ID=37642 ORGANISM="Paraphysomonas imperforata, Strain PA2" /NCGR_SAMPLE_ID=MMETSP0104 /ASSEMBLY_ACC=CAM_ASM_000202 /LENGTH=427 /DNA_ID=CAMNT_0001640429 /DNA_START=126 /DNA_END=1409 /DNA_ORIENTATION=+